MKQPQSDDSPNYATLADRYWEVVLEEHEQINRTQFEAIFAQAWEQAHAHGYGDIHLAMMDLVGLVLTVLEAAV